MRNFVVTLNHILAILPSQDPTVADGQADGKKDGPFMLAREYLSQGNDVILVEDEYAIDGIAGNSLHKDGRVKRKLTLPEHDSDGLAKLSTSYFEHMDGFDTNVLERKFRRVLTQVHNQNPRENNVTLVNGDLMTPNVLGSIDRVIDYERSLKSLSQQNGTVEKLKLANVICPYETETINQMLVRHLIQLLSCHSFVLDWTNPVDQIECDSDTIHQCIATGINNVLGQGADRLLYCTLGSIYRIKQDQIISQPEIFEAKLRKILGHSASKVLDSIAIELRSEIYNLAGYLPADGATRGL